MTRRAITAPVLAEGPGAPQPARAGPGRAVQVDPINPMLKAPGTKHLKLKYYKLLSSFAFKFNLCRYTLALRVMSSIRVNVIVPVVILAVRKCAVDASPYVRKAAAHAIPKVGRCRLCPSNTFTWKGRLFLRVAASPPRGADKRRGRPLCSSLPTSTDHVEIA